MTEKKVIIVGLRLVNGTRWDLKCWVMLDLKNDIVLNTRLKFISSKLPTNSNSHNRGRRPQACAQFQVFGLQVLTIYINHPVGNFRYKH